MIGRERLRQILQRNGIALQRTKTWKESTDPDRDVKLAQIEYVTAHMPHRAICSTSADPLPSAACTAVLGGRLPGILTGSR